MLVRVIMTRQVARRGKTLDTSLLPVLSDLLIELRARGGERHSQHHKHCRKAQYEKQGA